MLNTNLFKQVIEGAELNVLEDIGHVPLMEDPNRVGKLVDAFIDKND